MDWKEKYPIGSQWKCRDGSKVVVVEHRDRDERVFVYCRDRGVNALCKSLTHGEIDSRIEPWKEPRVFETDILVGEYLDSGRIAIFGEDDFCNPLYKIIARKKITIAEGEGVL